MTARVFVDTNVFVYAFDEDEPEKRERAIQRLEELGPTRAVVSTQVLQELYVTLLRKLKKAQAADAAFGAVDRLTAATVINVHPAMVFSAIELSRSRQMAFWDALIVCAALESGATRLWTEDLQHGQSFEKLVVENPFLG